jgi:hypothetical protein
VSFAAITLYVATQLVFIVVYFVIASDRKLLDIPAYVRTFSPHYIKINHDVSEKCVSV